MSCQNAPDKTFFLLKNASGKSKSALNRPFKHFDYTSITKLSDNGIIRNWWGSSCLITWVPAALVRQQWVEVRLMGCSFDAKEVPKFFIQICFQRCVCHIFTIYKQSNTSKLMPTYIREESLYQILHKIIAIQGLPSLLLIQYIYI